jgi:protein SCO1/2
MMNWRTIRRTMAGGSFAAAACALLCVSLSAQVSSYGDKQEGQNVGDELPKVLKQVGVTQRLDQHLPMDAQFVDDHGKTVKLGDYFGKKPALLSLVYYNCPMLCSEEMDGIASALEMVKLEPGKDFNVIIISIDPSETPEIAAKKKDRRRMAFPDGQAAGDRCGGNCDRIWLHSYSRAGRQDGPVRARQLN